MLYAVIYLCVTLWLIHYVTKEIRNCPYCGRKMKPEYSKFGVVWECKCGIVAKYTSMLEAANANGVTKSAISAAIRGYCKTCKKSIFEYE